MIRSTYSRSWDPPPNLWPVSPGARTARPSLQRCLDIGRSKLERLPLAWDALAIGHANRALVRSAAVLLSVLMLNCHGEATAGTAPATTPAAASTKPPERLITVDRSMLEQGRIVLAVAELRPMTDDLLVTGQVIAPPHGKAEIGALLTSRIHGISVEEGQVVKKGQVLATLVAPDAARLSGEFASARARRARAEVVLAQEKRLAEQSATSERAVTEATSEAASARADESAASVMLGTYDVRGAQLTLRSPLAGIVAASNALLGAQVEPDTILFRVVDPAQLVVRADVPESMANRVRVGSGAEIRLPAQGASCPAVIVSSTRSVDPIKRTVSFRIKPSEGCGTMLEGGFADVQLPLDQSTPAPTPISPAHASPDPGVRPTGGASENAAKPGEAQASARRMVALPRSAVVELDGVPIAFVATGEPGQFRALALTIARHSETTAWVEQGLAGGERIASRGALLLKGELMKSRLE
jgi:membrane fusion protein, heavy metal efflux system